MPDEVLDLRGRDPRDAVRVEERRDPAAEPEREPTVREPVHRGRVRRGDHRVARVVIRRRGRDAERRRHRADRARERERLLDVEAFGDERGAETEALARGDLVDQLDRRLRRAGQHVEAELVQLRLVHPSSIAPSWSPPPTRPVSVRTDPRGKNVDSRVDRIGVGGRGNGCRSGRRRHRRCRHHRVLRRDGRLARGGCRREPDLQRVRQPDLSARVDPQPRPGPAELQLQWGDDRLGDQRTELRLGYRAARAGHCVHAGASGSDRVPHDRHRRRTMSTAAPAARRSTPRASRTDSTRSTRISRRS